MEALLSFLIGCAIASTQCTRGSYATAASSTNQITSRKVHYNLMASNMTAKLKRYQKSGNKVSALKDMMMSGIDVDIGKYDAVEWTELIGYGRLSHVDTEVV